MSLRTRTVALLAIPGLALGLAACGDDNDQTVVTDAPEATKASEALTGDDQVTTEVDDDVTTTTSAAPIGQDAATVKIAGTDVDGDFTPVRCEYDRDDDTLKVKAGEDDDTGKLEVEIKDADTAPRLDELSVEVREIDMEIDDENAEAANVSRDGDTWRIVGTGVNDDDTTDDIEAEVVCPLN